MLREGMFIAERYEILQKIGSGGMSDVYKAKCHKLNRFVAIKVLKNEFSEDKNFVSKFRAEAQAAAGLMHANIVNVYDVGEENGIYYIVMELVEGITLKKYIDKKGILGVREAVSIAIQVAQGIEAAHKHSIVHRDIKPQNIIISKEGKVKVTDFGIARAASSNTINSTVMGSVHYISPEQARGGYSDEKSDIYSFGITLFEMLTGKVPFEGDTTVAIALQHIQDDMVSPITYVPEIPVSVEKIVLKCTQKKTEKRYSNISDLIADLKRSLVTPDDDFVVMGPALTSDAPTKMLNADEMNEIAEKASVKAVGLDVINPNTDKSSDLFDDNDDLDESDNIFSVTTEGGEDTDNTDDYDDDDDEDEDSKDTKKIDKIIMILSIAVAVVVVAIIAVVITKIAKSFGGGDNQPSKKPTSSVTTEATSSEEDGIKVPDLYNKTYEEAEKILNDMGLGIKKEDDAYSRDVEAGKICKQSIVKDTVVPEHSTIIVTVSKGQHEIEMPKVIGMTREEFEKTMTECGLLWTTGTPVEIDDDTKIGTICSSDPEAGTKLIEGDTVTVCLYIGRNNYEVPSFVGMTESEARRKIENECHFKIGEVTYEFDDEVKKDVVIAQSGAVVGELAPKYETTINLVVSKGSDKKEVPELKGLTEAEAKEALEKLELKLGKKTEEYSDTVDAGIIIRLEGVAVGDKVAAETEIDYVVSLGKKPEETTEAPTTEAPTTEAPVATEKTATVKVETTIAEDGTVAAQVVASKVTEVFAKCEKEKEIKFIYTLAYADSANTPSTKQIASISYENYNKMLDSAPYNVEYKLTDFTAGTATVTLTITYFGY